MTHVIHEFVQGSPEWHAHRDAHLNASEAPAMLGMSEYQSRSDLLSAKATGTAAEVTPQQQSRFDDGHAFEAIARPWAEAIIGEELYPIVASVEVDGLPLSASYDGVTMSEDVLFEHKTLNAALRESLSRGEIPAQYKPQMEQQLLVIGAQKCLFIASAGQRETMLHAWYESDPALRAKLISGWAQFKTDLANFKPVEVIPAAVAEPVLDLPAVTIQVGGALTLTSNLDKFGEQLRVFVKGINQKPETDQDFANAEAAVKTLAKAEERLEQAQSAALAQTASIDEMCRAVEMYRSLARETRLMLEKLVKSRKDAIRVEILTAGKEAFAAHVAALNTRLGKPYMPAIPVDFAGAMKGKRTISSLRDAVNTELARAKIEANDVADRIQINLNLLRDVAKDHSFLFSDAAQIVLKAPDDCATLVKLRIAEHKAKEEARLQAERDRIRAEDQDKLTKEALERARADERERIRLEEAERRPETAAPVQRAAPAAAKPSEGGLPFAADPHPAARATRPTDDQIIEALALHFRVHESKIIEWLLEMDILAASNRMVERI